VSRLIKLAHERTLQGAEKIKSHIFDLRRVQFLGMGMHDLLKKAAENPSGAWTVLKTASELSSKLFAFRKTLKSAEEKQQIDEILDALSELKQLASKLEDENRELRKNLRFRSDDYVFRTPFRFHKDRPDVALCVKCFANEIEAPMGEPGLGVSPRYRHCLVCGNNVEIEKQQTSSMRLTSDYPFNR
jgi:hypothetical protein